VSFDLYIIPARPGLTPDDVNASFDRIEAGEAWPFGEPTDALRACLADIVQTFPRISDFDTDQIEDTIWSCNPDWVDGFLALNMRWNTTPEQINQIVSTAHRHGFAVHDPQEDRILMPPKSRTGWSGFLNRVLKSTKP
jgi:hypothetical protein